MKDRVTAGLISGIIAGIAMNIIDWIAVFLGLYRERLLDWAAVLLYGHLPRTTMEIAFAQLCQILFAGFLGLIFSSLLLKFSSGNYLVKGWTFSILAWFSIYGISIAIRLPNFTQHEFLATVSHFISASIYGLVLAYTLNKLEKIKMSS